MGKPQWFLQPPLWSNIGSFSWIQQSFGESDSILFVVFDILNYEQQDSDLIGFRFNGIIVLFFQGMSGQIGLRNICALQYVK